MKPPFNCLRRKTGSLAVALLLLLCAQAGAQPKWAVHEWGTFTSLQNESGEAVGGINTDDEPVPAFVHRLDNFVLLHPTELPAIFFQGAPSCHPDVTMRLETPVIYFHPTAATTNVQTASVRVKFHGGWLSEFYPDANLEVPGLENGQFHFGRLLAGTDSTLAWDNLKIGGDWPLTNATAHVWTSPRAVQAAAVKTTNGESEKFLFYRGVAHLDAPLKISRDAKTGELLFRSQLADLPANKPLAIRSLWLVDIRPGGKIAFRSLPPLAPDHDSKKILARTAVAFSPADFSADNLKNLKASLQSALVAEGLFADEAQALLNTWELSYFKSTGLRVFFLVPRAWTDFYLPLEISPAADIRRVMVGRIELVTPQQRLGLETIARYSVGTITNDAVKMWKDFYASPAIGGLGWQPLASGEKPLSSAIAVPPSYQTYLDLGRFRNALILDEARTHSATGLTNFIATYRLQAWRPMESSPALSK